ncbi:unnamed protein product [Linum tenue]|uniref:Uncharacterized protein n=1 Tax=Linum tenue TaxID=586396 RepID=A0AAV0P411_9ROSI|nr:unnamed protein product [Linum tenue]
MEVIIPSSPGGGMGFDFNDARPLPFLSAPASPRRFGDLTLSAPTSPGRVAEFYRSFENFSEEKPGTPKSPKKLPSFNDQDFAFDFSADSEMSSLTADELFDDGKIRPLKLPPRMQVEEIKSPLVHSPRSPRSPIEQGKRIINRRGAARSLSPYRVSQYPWEEEERQFQQQQHPQPEPEHNLQPVSSAAPAAAAQGTGKSSSRKWRLRDLLLFRSASEGRAADRDPYRKHAAFGGLFRRHDDVKSCSIRSSDSNGSNSGSMRRKGPVSAHELHYTKNKAASEDMKKRTYLPYKQGILGMRLAFSPSPAR